MHDSLNNHDLLSASKSAHRPQNVHNGIDSQNGGNIRRALWGGALQGVNGSLAEVHASTLSVALEAVSHPKHHASR